MDDTSTKGAAVIMSDSEINLFSIQEDVQKFAERYSHPLLLLLQLFQHHVMATSTKFKEVYQKVREADNDLHAELKKASRLHAESNNTNDSKLRGVGSNFGPIGQSLHEARMNLVELTRRRQFETQIGRRLLQDLEDEQPLMIQLNMLIGLSQSHELDIQSLPQRIDSQTTVVSAS
jgi:hypothetical protein